MVPLDYDPIWLDNGLDLIGNTLGGCKATKLGIEELRSANLRFTFNILRVIHMFIQEAGNIGKPDFSVAQAF